MEMITNETEITATGLACVLGITTRHVRRLKEDGVLFKNKNGLYNLSGSVRAYINYAMTNAIRKKVQTPDDEKKLNQSKKKADTALKEKRLSKMDYETESARIENEIKMLKLEEMRNNLYSAELVADMFTQLVYTVRTNLLAMPGRLAIDVHNSANAAECAEIIRRDVHAIMKDLSNWEYDGEAFARRKKEMGLDES